MIQKITKELMKTMDKYNEMKAIRIEEDPQPMGLINITKPTKEQTDRMTDLIRQKQAPHVEARFEIDVDEYWLSMIESKIEMIGAIGGFELLQDVFEELQKQDVGRKNRYNGIFNSAATGIQGWYA